MAETINVSTYELLVKPIITRDQSPNRTVIQGYFLTIANPSFSNLEIRLTFTALTPSFDSSSFAAFWDVNGDNNPLAPIPVLIGESEFLRSYEVNLPALDTGLFLLLPDVREEEVVVGRDTEIRGYVTLSIPSASFTDGDNMRTLLLSAQQRGTFLPQGDIEPPDMGDFDQLSYSLPLANGGSEVTLEADVFAVLPPRQVILDAIEKNPSLLSSISSDPFVQQISKFNADEQRQILKVLLKRVDARQEQIQSS
ncbi:conserved hypothetical protein [Hyella patelloides LEGE 07179]|uniref:Uncharacterized protein n=1 Tax=Hyella patelloides LEGE 07179 TaxID=945734 RepID=A0A563VJC1_9CYAN|nr:hypothetical protein [Hyella patelloides]VEP11556.1 conserved hypothetical protein [Hyella patelloides LEGE 07179]